MKLILNLLIIGTFISLTCAAVPYLVSIRRKGQQIITTSFDLCNGAIIHKDYILTTATCMHFQASNTGTLYPLSKSGIEIVTSNSSIIRNIATVDIVPGFNASTWENDLALVKLNESIPLTNRSDLQWISLGRNNKFSYSCFASFFVDSPNIPEVQSAHSMNEYFCSRGGNYSATKRLDICSTYNLIPGTYCADNIWHTLQSNTNRGAALICDSKLFGLLSLIIPPHQGYNISCTDARKLQAFYTRVPTYITWIESIVGPLESTTSSNMFTTITPGQWTESTTMHSHTPVKPPKKNEAISGITTSFTYVLITSIIFIIRDV